MKAMNFEGEEKMKVTKHLLMMTAFVLAMLTSGVSIFAQQAKTDKPQPAPEGNVIFERRAMEGPSTRATLPPDGPDELMPPGEGYRFNFVSSEMSLDGKLVKNAPYSAEAVTETVQMLADGNRIVHKNSASVYRDSEGRTRRDQTFGAIGPFAAAGDPPQSFFINDPVKGVHYILDPRGHMAYRMKAGGESGFRMATRIEGAKVEGKTAMLPPPSSDKRVMIYHTASPEGTVVNLAPNEKSKNEVRKEALGKQVIEGVEAEGTRLTVTIPAGEIGNERAIEIVTERWYSPELQTLVLSKRNDPMGGDTTYRLTNINRTEPARTLFEVPADYTIKEGPAAPTVRVMRMKKPE
jgi:hypothetical protein